MANEIIVRTEDIKDEELLSLFVETSNETNCLEQLMNKTPILLVGSRGTGKTMLLRVAERKLDVNYLVSKTMAVRVSFDKSLLIDGYSEPLFFRQWMLSKILFALKRKIQKLGMESSSRVFDKFFQINHNSEVIGEVEAFIRLLEESFRNKNIDIEKEVRAIFGVSARSVNIINELDYFKALIEDICTTYGVSRVVLLFDEACHNFIPNQQREFFTLYRDLRSPYIVCKAAVYPGITSYGDTFQKFHDTTVIRIEKDLKDVEYVDWMRQIVRKQIDPSAYKKLTDQGDNFNSLIFASSGNPRLLLKSINQASDGFKKLKTDDVTSTIKNFYRNDIWNDHTKLGEKYIGHKPFIDWGRTFLEGRIAKEISKRNQDRESKGVKYRSIYFAIHKDAPESVKASIRILEYSGIILINAESVKGTNSEIYDRYQINLGILLAEEARPNISYQDIVQNLSTRNNYYPEFGMNSPAYEGHPSNLSANAINLDHVIDEIVKKDISVLEFTYFQVKALRSIGINSLGDILRTTEEKLRLAKYVGNVRSRKMFNIALNAAFEYISG